MKFTFKSFILPLAFLVPASQCMETVKDTAKNAWEKATLKNAASVAGVVAPYVTYKTIGHFFPEHTKTNLGVSGVVGATTLGLVGYQNREAIKDSLTVENAIRALKVATPVVAYYGSQYLPENYNYGKTAAGLLTATLLAYNYFTQPGTLEGFYTAFCGKDYAKAAKIGSTINPESITSEKAKNTFVQDLATAKTLVPKAKTDLEIEQDNVNAKKNLDTAKTKLANLQTDLINAEKDAAALVKPEEAQKKQEAETKVTNLKKSVEDAQKEVVEAENAVYNNKNFFGKSMSNVGNFTYNTVTNKWVIGATVTLAALYGVDYAVAWYREAEKTFTKRGIDKTVDGIATAYNFIKSYMPERKMPEMPWTKANRLQEELNGAKLEVENLEMSLQAQNFENQSLLQEAGKNLLEAKKQIKGLTSDKDGISSVVDGFKKQVGELTVEKSKMSSVIEELSTSDAIKSEVINGLKNEVAGLTAGNAQLKQDLFNLQNASELK